MRLALLLVLVLATAVVAVAAASADTGTPGDATLSGTDAVAAIQDASPASLTNVATDTASDGDSAVTDDNKGVSVDVPVDPEDGISLSGGASSEPLTITLPQAAAAGDAQPVTDSIVAYDNGDGSATVPLVKTDGSLEIDTVIADASAASSFTYGLSVPSGATLAQDESGAVTVSDSAGNFVAGITPAWAKDANGNAVPTHFEIDGDQLTQVVDTSDPSIAFPVVADPWLWRDTIDHTTWSYAVPGDPRLQVFPTTWGRVFSGVAVWGEQWGEVLSKTHTHRDWANTNEMKWQFECHLSLGANLWKSSYNLDTSGRRGSLWGYVTHKCN